MPERIVVVEDEEGVRELLLEVLSGAGYDVVDFWEAIEARPPGSLILDPDEFYILASKESVSVPPAYVAEMAPFDPLVPVPEGLDDLYLVRRLI